MRRLNEVMDLKFSLFHGGITRQFYVHTVCGVWWFTALTLLAQWLEHCAQHLGKSSLCDGRNASDQLSCSDMIEWRVESISLIMIILLQCYLGYDGREILTKCIDCLSQSITKAGLQDVVGRTVEKWTVLRPTSSCKDNDVWRCWVCQRSLYIHRHQWCEQRITLQLNSLKVSLYANAETETATDQKSS